MASIEPNVAGLAIFAGLWTAACLGFLVLAGMFPASTRPAGARLAGGRALVVLNSLLWLGLAAAALGYGYANLRFTSLIVVGGLVLLFAPAPFDLLPTSYRDGRRGLAALVVLQGSALAAWAALPGGGAAII